MTPPAPAHLHVLLASENDFALVIRRGPTKQVCTLGWNRADDSFQLGQWLKGTIDFGSCDLSPNCRHFIYGAAKWPHYYTVVSRAPFLKALHLWSPKKGRSYGGGFLNNTRLWVTGGSAPDVRDLPFFARVNDAPELATRSSWDDIAAWRRERDGWQLRPDDHQCRELWHKILGEWTLLLSIPSWEERKPDFYELRHNATDEVVASGEWNWADFDAPRERLCLARDGQLWALDLKPNAQEKLIHDFNAMTFEPIVAPY